MRKHLVLRRAACSVVCVILSLLSFCMSATAVADEAVLQDVNGDGVVNAFDYVLTKRECVDAAKPFTVAISTAEAQTGKTVSLDVSIKNNPGFLSAYFVIQYHQDLELLSGDDGVDCVTGEGAGEQTFNLISNGLRGSLLCMTNQSALSSADGLLISLTFRLPEENAGTFYAVSMKDFGCVGADGVTNTPLLYEHGGVRSIAVEHLMPGPNTVDPKPLSWGIDVSAWQGQIDWEMVQSSGASFAVLRAGYGRYDSQVDRQFYENYTEAKYAGMPLGAYWYSYAMSPAEAVTEAQVCLRVLNGMTFEYPIAFDIEEYAQKCLGKEQFSAIIDAFCSTMQSAGYYVVIYSSASPLNTLVTEDVRSKYDVWVANYHVDKPIYTGKYGMWQYSSTGSVAGIASDVDMNYSYRDYSKVIISNGLNGYPVSPVAA